MKRLNLLLALSALLTFPLAAADDDDGQIIETLPYLTQYDRLYVSLRDGGQYTVAIDSTSQVHGYLNGDGQRCVDIYGRDGNYHFLRSELRSLSCIESETQGIISLDKVMDERITMFRLLDEHLLFTPSMRGHQCVVTDLSGRLITRFAVPDDCRFDTRSLRPGIYLVNVDCHTFKLLNR